MENNRNTRGELSVLFTPFAPFFLSFVFPFEPPPESSRNQKQNAKGIWQTRCECLEGASGQRGGIAFSCERENALLSAFHTFTPSHFSLSLSAFHTFLRSLLSNPISRQMRRTERPVLAFFGRA